MKKIIRLAVLLTASCCVLGAAGCGGKTRNVAALSSNWYSNTSIKTIQPNMKGEDYAEKLTYKLTFEKSGLDSLSYTANYPEGELKTTFFWTDFDKENLVHADFKEGYPKENIEAYCYKTEQTVKVNFTCNGETSETFTDSVVTECYFLPVKDYLRPLYSTRTVKSTTPADYQATELSKSFMKIDRRYVNFYSYDGDSVISETSVNPQDRYYESFNGEKAQSEAKVGVSRTNKLNSSKNSLFDLASLDILIRSTSLRSDLALNVSTYSENNVQDFLLQNSAVTLGDEEKTNITAKLLAAGLYEQKPAAEGEEPASLQTAAVSVNYTGSQYSGVSQRYIFAAVTNKVNNISRATLLKISVPLFYNQGTLHYTLDSVEQTLWNK